MIQQKDKIVRSVVGAPWAWKYYYKRVAIITNTGDLPWLKSLHKLEAEALDSLEFQASELGAFITYRNPENNIWYSVPIQDIRSIQAEEKPDLVYWTAEELARRASIEAGFPDFPKWVLDWHKFDFPKFRAQIFEENPEIEHFLVDWPGEMINDDMYSVALRIDEEPWWIIVNQDENGVLKTNLVRNKDGE